VSVCGCVFRGFLSRSAKIVEPLTGSPSPGPPAWLSTSAAATEYPTPPFQLAVHTMAAFSRASASVVGPCLCRPPVLASVPSRAFSTVNQKSAQPRQSTSHPVRRTRSAGSLQSGVHGVSNRLKKRTRGRMAADNWPSLSQRSFHSSPAWAAKDPYQVLGVGKDASTSEIKKNYYKVRDTLRASG
jgi:hypothetical protein